MVRRLMDRVRWPRSKGPGPEAKLRPARDVLAAERDGLVVLLDLRREVYLGLDEVGTTIWRGIEQGSRVRELAQRVADEYDAPMDRIEPDTIRFIDELISRRLVLFS